MWASPKGYLKQNFHFTIEIDIVYDNIKLLERSSLPDISVQTNYAGPELLKASIR